MKSACTHLILALVFLLPVFSVSAESPVVKRPDAKRFAKEIAKFDAADAAKTPPKGGIVFTGSSSIRLWSTLEKDFPGLPVLNRGFGGSIAHDLTVYADQVVLRYEPKLVVIYTGSNDINAKLGVKQSLADYVTFLELIHDKVPQARVILNSIKVSTKRIEQMPQVKELNTLLEAWAKEREWVRWVDATDCLINQEGKPKDELFMKDLLHLNKDGYQQWLGILAPVVAEEWAKVKEAQPGA